MVRIDSSNSDSANIFVVLQKGVLIEAPDTTTVSGFISSVFNISFPVLKNDMKTIMLNNKVVDIPEEVLLSAGDTLVLSGALPGLVGAMLRSDSPLKVMRAGITLEAGENKIVEGKSFIKVKLFNTVLQKYQSVLVRHGFYILEEREMETE